MASSILSCQCGTHYLPQRYIFTFMVFFGVMLGYSSRNCLHVAITQMVKEKNDTSTQTDGACKSNNSVEPPKKGGAFDWSETEQAGILIAFFYGYIVSHVPGGVLADMFGGKHVFGAGIFLSGLSSFLIPLVVNLWQSPWPVAGLRVLMGLGQGSLFPAATSMVTKWAPKAERSLIGSIVVTGSQIGSISGNWATSGLISYMNDWQFPFYLWGIMCFVWYLLFLIMVYSEPAHCPFITEEEGAMLAADIGPSQRKKIPWKAILTSCPVWCVILVSCGHDIVFFFLGVQYPKYLKNVLKFNLKEIGIYTSTPYILLFITSNTSAFICDKIIGKQYLSVLNTRKLFTILGSVLPGVFFVSAVYMNCERIYAVIMFYLCLLTMGPYYPGLRVNPVDLTKNFGGIVMAFVNGFGAVAYLPFPQLSGHFTQGHSPAQWYPIFWAMFVIVIVTLIPFLIWGQAEKQPWDELEDEE